MLFCEKLDRLMKIYRMNNVTLARGTGVDASLVSRWRSGSRVPSARSGVPEDIGAFLAGAPILPLDESMLHQTLGCAPDERDEMGRVIAEWLKADHIISFPAAVPKPSEPPPHKEYMGAAGTVGRMAHVLGRDTPDNVGPVNLWPYVQRGNPAEHEVFSGESGKRKAVISFLHKIQNAPRPLDIFILIGASQDWITRDETFAALWPRCLLAMLQRSHRLHIVVPEAELGDALKSWLALPLFHTSQCRIYAIPERSVDTLVVAQGYAAVLSYGVGPKEEATLLFSGVMDSSTFEAVFHRWLKNGYPVLFTCEEAKGFADRLLALEGRSGAYYQARNSFSALCLSEPALRALLAEAQIPEANEYVARHLRRLSAMETQLAAHDWVEILPRRVLDTAARDGGMTLDGRELGLERDLFAPPETVKAMLGVLIARLEACPRMHVILPDTELLPIQIMYKESAGAYFTLAQPDAPASRPAGVFLGQPDGLRALGEWFSSMSYDREETLRLLRNCAGSL